MNFIKKIERNEENLKHYLKIIDPLDKLENILYRYL